MKGILIEAGFDTKTSLINLEKNNLVDIEEFVQSNRATFAAILKGTQYEKIDVFKFLPGHKNLIINLSKHLSGTIKIQKKIRSSKIQLTTDELKAALVKKISNYSKNNNFTIDCTSNDISELQLEEKPYKCKIKCPWCDDKLSCTFETYWIISNLVRHIKSRHVTYLEVDPLNQTDIENSIVRMAPGQQRNLMQFLDESDENLSEEN